MFNILDNLIDGEAFVELTEEDLKGIIQPIGVIKKIMRFQQSIKVCG